MGLVRLGCEALPRAIVDWPETIVSAIVSKGVAVTVVCTVRTMLLNSAGASRIATMVPSAASPN